jgi:hypothetical protein
MLTFLSATLCLLLSLSQLDGVYAPQEMDQAVDNSRRQYVALNSLSFTLLTPNSRIHYHNLLHPAHHRP